MDTPLNIVEFSQDEIDLEIAALELWAARIHAEEADKYNVPRPAHWQAGSYCRGKIVELIKKLRAW